VSLPHILLLVLALAGAAGLVYFLRGSPEWRLEVEGGRLKVRRGNVPGRFFADCEQICRDWRIEKGRIEGVRREGGRVSLRFSKEIPAEHHQRFRNAWGFHGG